MQYHELKIWPEYFEDVYNGTKTFEVRKNDRNFHVGDTVTLKEWDNNSFKYSQRQLSFVISHLLQGGQFGIESGFVVMSFSKIISLDY
jgi:hypothetical protein